MIWFIAGVALFNDPFSSSKSVTDCLEKKGNYFQTGFRWFPTKVKCQALIMYSNRSWQNIFPHLHLLLTLTVKNLQSCYLILIQFKLRIWEHCALILGVKLLVCDKATIEVLLFLLHHCDDAQLGVRNGAKYGPKGEMLFVSFERGQFWQCSNVIDDACKPKPGR